MFFSNLQKMRIQCDLLLDMDPQMVEDILENGHDWAQDHIAEAKNNMDQVFDFLMNETKKSGMELSMNIDDSDMMNERWSQKYKRSINCNNPRGFSQRAYCQGRNKK
jgi:homospermidine synthase